MSTDLLHLFWRDPGLVSSLVPLHGIFHSCIQSGLHSRGFGEAAFALMTVLIILGCE